MLRSVIFREAVPAFWRLTIQEGKNGEVEQSRGWNAKHLTQCTEVSWDHRSFQEGAVWGYLVLPAVRDIHGGLGGCEIPN